jgi:hypothetical protein
VKICTECCTSLPLLSPSPSPIQPLLPSPTPLVFFPYSHCALPLFPLPYSPCALPLLPLCSSSTPLVLFPYSPYPTPLVSNPTLPSQKIKIYLLITITLRLYTLDQQVHHADHESLQRLGYWLWHRTKHCRDKRMAAEEILCDCRQDSDVLHREWDAQVKHQTKPLPHVFVSPITCSNS